MTCTALIDKYSGKKKLLCPKGAKLKITSVRIDVLIVEYKGDIFSIHINEVKLNEATA